MSNDYETAIAANIEVHSRLAATYNEIEPHFRPESIARVEQIVANLAAQMIPEHALDLGCGTGFMINILKQYFPKITGVDVTQAMLDRVDLSGPAEIRLLNADTGKVQLEPSSFDLVCAYTFLDHLYDMGPTFRTAHAALKSGGWFYADLSPNHQFWHAFKNLELTQAYTPEITRELNAVLSKDEEIEKQFGIDRAIFRDAEYQKHVKGGLDEEALRAELHEAGFREVKFLYHWYVGQAFIVNNPKQERSKNLLQADLINSALLNMLPLSRHLFKYIGFIATKTS